MPLTATVTSPTQYTIIEGEPGLVQLTFSGTATSQMSFSVYDVAGAGTAQASEHQPHGYSGGASQWAPIGVWDIPLFAYDDKTTEEPETFTIGVRLDSGATFADGSTTQLVEITVLDSLVGYGSTDGDRYEGSRHADTYNGLQGADEILGRGGDDTLFGEAGNDLLRGGAGRDQLDGGNNSDELRGDAGQDLLLGANGADKLYGGLETDQLYGGMGADTIWGEDGRDHLYGDDGNDRAFGGAGSDRLFGGTGNDRLDGGTGDDRLEGGAGLDTFIFAGGSDLVLDFQDDVDTLQIDRDLLPRGVTSVGDVLALARDADGDTVIRLADGATLRIAGITDPQDLADDLVLI